MVIRGYFTAILWAPVYYYYYYCYCYRHCHPLPESLPAGSGLPGDEVMLLSPASQPMASPNPHPPHSGCLGNFQEASDGDQDGALTGEGQEPRRERETGPTWGNSLCPLVCFQSAVGSLDSEKQTQNCGPRPRGPQGWREAEGRGEAEAERGKCYQTR